MTSYLPVAVGLAIISFILFRILYLSSGTIWLRAGLVTAAFVLITPAVWFASYYLLYMPCDSWFISFRSLPAVEASSGLAGALLGIMFASARLRPNKLNVPILAVSAVAAVLLLVTPFGKQIFSRQDYSKLGNKWNNGICEQTSSSTCVPACCATLVRMLGGDLTERELAREAGTNTRGTEVWYMIRALRKHGYELDVRVASSIRDVPAPSIMGVMVGDAGHVVVLMSKTDAGPEIADPLFGYPRCYTWGAFEKRYRPRLAYYVISPASR